MGNKHSRRPARGKIIPENSRANRYVKSTDEDIEPLSSDVIPLRTPPILTESRVRRLSLSTNVSPLTNRSKSPVRSPGKISASNVNSMSFALSVLNQHSPKRPWSATLGELDLHDDELNFLNFDVLQFVNHAIGASPNAVICCDAFGKIYVYNKAAQEIFGFTYHEIVGKSINELMPSHFAKVHDYFLISYRETGTKAFFNRKRQVTCRKKDGVDIPIEITVTEIMFEEASPMSGSGPESSDQSSIYDKSLFLCHLRSVQTEVHMRMLMKLHVAISDTSAIPIVGIETDCSIQIFNKAASEAFGYSSAEVMGRNVNILMPEKYRPYHDSFISNYMRTGIKHILGKSRLDTAIRKNGENFPVELKISEVISEGQRFFIGFIRDQSTVITRDEESNRSQIADRIYPPVIAARVIEGEKIHDHHPSVSVVFVDIVGFTAMSSKLSSARIVELLDSIFTLFDEEVANKYGLEKIKTIGDCYMVACGIPSAIHDHAESCIRGALDMLDLMKVVNENNPDLSPITIRIGIHSGEATAGIVGSTKPAYDIWGDAVNTASRMESCGVPGEIHISEDTHNLLSSEFQKLFVKRDPISIKGKGIMTTYITEFNNKMK